MMQAGTWLSLLKQKGDAELGARFYLTVSPVSRGGMCPCAGSGLHLGPHAWFGGEFEMFGGRVCVSPALFPSL